MATPEKRTSTDKLVTFSVRLPVELWQDLPKAAEFLHAKDPSELVRGWIREGISRLDKDPRYRKFKEEK